RGEGKRRPPSMKSLQEAYCTATGCPAAKFRARIFRRCLSSVTWLMTPLLGGINSDYFSADRDLIAQIGRAGNMERVREEVRDYFHDPRNRGWLRGRLKLRLSTSRLRAVAREYLPGEDNSAGASRPGFPHVGGRTGATGVSRVGTR